MHKEHRDLSDQWELQVLKAQLDLRVKLEILDHMGHKVIKERLEKQDQKVQ